MREGAALLQGLATCGKCGRRLHTHYRGRNATPGYHCSGKDIVRGRGVYCLNIGGVQIDQAVVNAFLVTLAEIADQGVVDKDLRFRKALAAATKAYSLHSLPIYMFDMGCIFEMLGNTASAQRAFRSFLESQGKFKPSDVDNIALKQCDVEAAVRDAHEKLS